MLKNRTIGINDLLAGLCLVFVTNLSWALDYPHKPDNPKYLGMGCLSCHDLHGSLGKLLKAVAANPDKGGDDTEANNLCWS